MNDTKTLHNIVVSILNHNGMTLSELAKSLDISELQLAREIGKNKKIEKSLLIKLFSLLNVSLISNKTGEKIEIADTETLLTDALNKL